MKAKKLSFVFLLSGTLLGLTYYLSWQILCQERPDGTYGELYGPMLYFKPIVIIIVIIFLLLSTLFFIKSFTRKWPNGSPE